MDIRKVNEVKEAYYANNLEEVNIEDITDDDYYWMHVDTTEIIGKIKRQFLGNYKIQIYGLFAADNNELIPIYDTKQVIKKRDDIRGIAKKNTPRVDRHAFANSSHLDQHVATASTAFRTYNTDISLPNDRYRNISTFLSRQREDIDRTNNKQGSNIVGIDVEAKEGEKACSICMVNKCNVCYVPCGHLGCISCSNMISTCHTCRANITNKVKTFF